MNQVLVEKKQAEKSIRNLIFLVTAPTIVDLRWADIPESLKTDCHLSRILSLDTEKATDVEAMAYISTASMAAPLPSDWFDIYMYLSKKWLRFKKMEIPTWVSGEDQLEPYQESKLNDLKRWIRRCQWEHFKRKT